MRIFELSKNFPVEGALFSYGLKCGGRPVPSVPIFLKLGERECTKPPLWLKTFGLYR